VDGRLGAEELEGEVEGELCGAEAGGGGVRLPDHLLDAGERQAGGFLGAEGGFEPESGPCFLEGLGEGGVFEPAADAAFGTAGGMGRLGLGAALKKGGEGGLLLRAEARGGVMG
jgi:hypothetical protein